MKELQAIRTRTNIQGLYFGRIWKKTKWPPEMNTRMLFTYQISFFARTPQHDKYKELRKKLREQGIHPKFQHEYVEKILYSQNMAHLLFRGCDRRCLT